MEMKNDDSLMKILMGFFDCGSDLDVDKAISEALSRVSSMINSPLDITIQSDWFETIKGKIYINEDSLVIKFDDPENEPDAEEKCTANQEKCEALRKDFLKYYADIATLDAGLIEKLASSLEDGKFHEEHKCIMTESSDPEKLSQAISKFMDLIDSLIMDRVVALKSRISRAAIKGQSAE